MLITHENVFVFRRNRGRQSGSICKKGWQEKAETFWDEKMVGVLSTWGKGEESEGSEMVLSRIWKSFKPAKRMGFSLKDKGESPSRFSAGTGFTFKKGSCGRGVKGACKGHRWQAKSLIRRLLKKFTGEVLRV